MTGGCLTTSPSLRLPRHLCGDRLNVHRLRVPTVVGILCLVLASAPLPASTTSGSGVDVPSAASVVVAPAPTHLTDGEDRILPARLDDSAEALSKANVLYAQALLESSPDNPHQTLDLLRQVASLDPHFAEAQVRIANLMLQLGQTEDAFTQLQGAIKVNPDSVSIEAALGYVQHLRGKSEEAIRLCTQALASDPTQAVCMRVLLENMSEQNNLAGGMLHIEDILKNSPTAVPSATWLSLAKLYVELARSDPHPPSGDVILKTLLPLYQQAAATEPPDLGSLLLLSDTYRDLGRKHEALKTLQEAAKLDPTDADLVVRCGDLESALGSKMDALHDYETAYGINPNLAGLRELLGRFYLDDGRFDDAVRLLEDAPTETPEDPSLLIDLAIAYDQIHLRNKAQEYFRRVFEADSCPPEAYLKLAAFQLGDHQVKQALATLTAAHRLFPRSVRVLFYEAIGQRYAANYRSALADLQAMRELSSEPDAGAFDVNYYLESALDLSLSNRKKEVESILREGLGNYPDNADLLNELAFFWADDGKNLSEAYTYSHRAAALDPDNGAIQDTCGWVEYRLGHYHDALPYLQRGAIMTNNDPVVLQHLGDTYLRLGRARDAVIVWRLALKKDPANHDLLTRIDAAPAQAKHVESRSAPHP